LIDEALVKNGGRRLVERAALNVTEGNVFDAFDEWLEKSLWPSLGSSNAGAAAGPKELKLEIDTQSRSTALGQEMQQGEVTETRLLSSESRAGGSRKRHIGIRLPSGSTYRAGDYLAVLPLNPHETVVRVLQRFSLPWDARIKIDADTATTFLPTGERISAHDILTGMVELGQPVTGKSISAVADSIPDAQERKKLQEESENLDFQKTNVTLLDLLERYPSATLPFGAFLAALPAMRVRQYSISSSPLRDPSVCTLTYSVIDAPHKSNSKGGHNFLGVCTNYLDRLTVGTRVQIALRPSRAGFHPPQDDEVPMVMACAGTGLAPFRAFVSERAFKHTSGKRVGPALLFYGLRAPDEDDMYREELDGYEKQGWLQVRRAYSAAPDKSAGAKHVQDRIWQDRKEVLGLFERDAHIYLCGSGDVGAAVDDVLARIWADHTGLGEDEAKEQLSKTKGERYWSDIFS
jgi:cytochrome P450/NADPH-cytochrome P450 reductase